MLLMELGDDSLLEETLDALEALEMLEGLEVLEALEGLETLELSGHALRPNSPSQ
jgi:hypothetical protein